MLTLFPTEALAQEADMSLAAYEEFAFEAMGLNEDDPVRYWNEKSAEQERLKERLETAREIRIIGPETDLTLSVEGRTFVNSAGRRNMPCGEVFSGPIEDSANGTVYFGIPAPIGGREVSGARLRFVAGKVVEASAEKGEEYLISLLDTDAGARYLGEIGIGTNYRIPQASGNVLFDEKLGGTVHLAIGRSYAQTGGKNDSSVHTDLVCDLRGGGELYADGELIQSDGRFLGFDLAGANDAGEAMLRVASVGDEAALESVRDALDLLGVDYEHLRSEPDEDRFPQTAYFYIPDDATEEVERALAELAEEYGFDAEVL